MKKLLTLVIPPLLLLALFSGATSLGAAGLTSLGQATYAAVPAFCPTGLPPEPCLPRNSEPRETLSPDVAADLWSMQAAEALWCCEQAGPVWRR